MQRVSGALLLIGLIACGFAALRAASETFYELARLGVYVILVAASMLAVARRNSSPGWAGFAIGGWAYFLPIFVFGSPAMVAQAPTNVLVGAYASRLFAKPVAPTGFAVTSSEGDWPSITYSHLSRSTPPMPFIGEVNSYNKRLSFSVLIGHLWMTLISAGLGLMVARRLARDPRADGEADRPPQT